MPLVLSAQLTVWLMNRERAIETKHIDIDSILFVCATHTMAKEYCSQQWIINTLKSTWIAAVLAYLRDTLSNFHQYFRETFISIISFAFFRLIWTCMNFHFNVLARYQREVFQFVEWNERERKRKINLASRRFDVWVSECVRVNYDEIKWNSLCMWRVWTHLSLPTILYEHAFALGNYLKISSFHAVFACALAFLMSMAHIYLSIHMYWICDVCKA